MQIQRQRQIRDKYNCFPFQYSASNGTMCNKEQLLCLADNLSIEQNRLLMILIEILNKRDYIWILFKYRVKYWTNIVDHSMLGLLHLLHPNHPQPLHRWKHSKRLTSLICTETKQDTFPSLSIHEQHWTNFLLYGKRVSFRQGHSPWQSIFVLEHLAKHSFQ